MKIRNLQWKLETDESLEARGWISRHIVLAMKNMPVSVEVVLLE